MSSPQLLTATTWLFVLLAARGVLAIEPPVTALAFLPNGKSVVVGSQAGLQVRTWPDLTPSIKLDSELLNVHSLSVSPDGKRLAVAGGAPGEQGVLELFSIADRRLQCRKPLHDDSIYGLAWHPDSMQLATSGLDRHVHVFDVREQSIRQTLRGHSRGVTSVCFLPDGETLVSAGIDQSLRVWELSSGKIIRTLDNHTQPVHGMALRPQSNAAVLPLLVSVSQDRSVRLWQPTIGRMVRFARVQAAPLAVRWTVDGKWLVVACSDGHLRVINPDTVDVVQDTAAVDGWAYTLAIPTGGNSALVGGANGGLVKVELSPE